MSEIVEHLKRRIEETQKEYEDAGRKRIALRELEQKLFQELEAYKLALKAEMRRSGIVMPIAPKVGKPTVLPPSPKGHETESVKDLIASRIKDAGEGGTTYKYLSGFIESRGLGVHRNYPYVVVGNLKKQGKVIDVDGKLVWQE